MESLGFLGLREQRMISGMSITEIILSWRVIVLDESEPHRMESLGLLGLQE